MRTKTAICFITCLLLIVISTSLVTACGGIQNNKIENVKYIPTHTIVTCLSTGKFIYTGPIHHQIVIIPDGCVINIVSPTDITYSVYFKGMEIPHTLPKGTNYLYGEHNTDGIMFLTLPIGGRYWIAPPKKCQTLLENLSCREDPNVKPGR